MQCLACEELSTYRAILLLAEMQHLGKSGDYQMHTQNVLPLEERHRSDLFSSVNPRE